MKTLWKISISIIALILNIKYLVFAQNINEVLIATAGSAKINLGEYIEFLPNQKEAVKYELIEKLVDISLLYQKAVELNLEKDESVKQKIIINEAAESTSDEERIWAKREILADAFREKTINECGRLEELVNKLIESQEKKYYFLKTLEMMQEQLKTEEQEPEIIEKYNALMCTEIWDEYLLDLRKEYKVNVYYSLLHVLLPEYKDEIISMPVIILPLTFTVDCNIVQEEPIIYNLPFSESGPYQDIVVVLEVKNELPGKLFPYIMADPKKDFIMKSNGIGLEIKEIENVEKSGKISVVGYIPNIEEISSLEIETNRIGYSSEAGFNFIWRFAKEEKKWKYNNNNLNRIVDYKPSFMKKGLEGVKFEILYYDAPLKLEYEEWILLLNVKNYTPDAVFLEWPPLVIFDTGEKIQTSISSLLETSKMMCSPGDYIGAFDIMNNIEIKINQVIPFSVKKIDLIFNIRENESKDSKNKIYKVTLARLTDKSFKVESEGYIE